MTTPRQPWRIAAWLAASLALLLALMLALAVAGLAWTVRSERGTLWLLSLLPNVQVDAPRGRLLGDFDAQQVRIRLGGEDQLVLNGVAWRGVSIARGHAPLWLRVEMDALAVARVDLTLVPPDSTTPSIAPTDLRLPIELDVRALRVGIAYATQLGSEPLRDLRAHVHLGANAGAEHRLDDLTLAWDRLQARGQMRISSAPPVPLQATLQLTQPATPLLPAWSANATLTGPLAEPLLQATLRAAAPQRTSPRAPPREPQALDLRATLRPFAVWPLGELQMTAQALDLAAFSSAAPTTALSGRAIADSSGVDQPATVSAELTNALPGRWNDGRLPVQRIALELSARPDEPNVLTLRRFDAVLGTPTARAGQLNGSARWAPAGWALDATLVDVQPALLDARAPAIRASGPIALSGRRKTVQVRAELSGQVQGLQPARPVRLNIDAALDPQRLELRALQASAGGARATFKGLLTHTATDAPWTVALDGTLVDFDPALWWPGRDDSPWRRQPSRLNTTLKIDVELPAEATTRPPLPMLAALRGDAELALAPSTLAGVPLTGSARLHSGANARVESVFDLRADGGNRVQASGKLAATGDGAGDVWDVTLTGPALARLAPVYALFGDAAARDPKKDPPLAGTLNATARINGRWPALSTKGQFEASALRIGMLTVQQAQGRWSLGTSLGAPVEAQVTLTQARTLPPSGAPGPSIDSATLQLQGTGRAHTLELRADSKAQPPAWVDTVQGLPTTPADAHTLATLRVQGGLIDAPGSPAAGWRGTLQQLELRSSSRAVETAPLLRARDVAIEALWAGGPARVALQPGRADVLGGAVRWSQAGWTAAARDGDYAQLQVQLEVDPIRVAPLLARVQPEFGWGGDLAVRARMSVRSAPTFHADVVVERASGDLTVTEESGMRTLGLTDLRLGLAADNGVWNFTQGLAGRTVGVAAGAVVVRTSPQASWPPADAPIEGVLELRVADLGTWGPWVPPGWRLAGALHASAGINGRFGAPEYTGDITGAGLSVRNFLQGVNVREGDVAIRLRGTTAQIERFSAKAGKGSVTLAGNASLGESPKAVLQLQADQFQLLGRIDRRIVTSGQGRLTLDAKSVAFNGEFKVDEGLIDFTRSDAPTLSADVEVVRTTAAPNSRDADAGATAAQVSREVALDVRVGLGDKLRLRGRGLDTGLAGDLRITSPGGRLAVNGTVRAVDGTYAAYGQKLAIDRGVIAFNGSVENPRLDIEATRPNLDVRVGVAVSGSATNPRVRLFSEPELSEIDKLSWLVMGRASDGLGRTDTALLQRAALALLAGEGGGPTDQLTKAIGLDEIGLRQTDNGEVRETVVSLGKQLSRRWYVGYERGLNATTGNFQLIYRIAQRFTLRAQSGQDNSLDLIWTWRWK